MTKKVLRIGGASGFWGDAVNFESAAMQPHLALIAHSMRNAIIHD